MAAGSSAPELFTSVIGISLNYHSYLDPKLFTCKTLYYQSFLYNFLSKNYELTTIAPIILHDYVHVIQKADRLKQYHV